MTRQVIVTIVRNRLDHLRRPRVQLARDSSAPADHVIVVMGGHDPGSVLALPGLGHHPAVGDRPRRCTQPRRR